MRSMARTGDRTYGKERGGDLPDLSQILQGALVGPEETYPPVVQALALDGGRDAANS